MKYFFILFSIFFFPFFASASLLQPALRINIHLKLRNEEELTKLVEQQQDPSSFLYRQWLSAAEFQERFAPSNESYSKVKNWALNNGLTIIESMSNNQLLVCESPIKAVTSAKANLQQNKILFNKYQIPSEFTSDIKWIEIPDSSKIFSFVDKNKSSLIVPLGINCDDKERLFTPQSLWSIYNLNSLYNNGIDGAGQKIAILIPGKFVQEDLSKFQNLYNLPNTKIELHTIGETTPNKILPESMAEIEYIAALAPKAIIQVIQIPTNSSGDVLASDLTAAISYVVDKLKDTYVITTSLGSCEKLISPETLSIQKSLLLQSAAAGQTWIISSGNKGIDACGIKNINTVYYPASDASVIAVGGTELIPKRDEKGKIIGYTSEVAWNNSEGVSGGGKSSIIEKPSYQSKLDLDLGDKRCIPDVSFHAGGGLSVIINGNNICYSGTGVGASAWAAVIALLNQSSGSKGLGIINEPLYSLGTAQAAETGSRIFHDVTSGNNFINGSVGAVTGPGYDLVTGWGAFDAENLIHSFSAGISRPKLQLSSNSIDFKMVRIGRRSELSKLNIKNIGTSTLLIKKIRLDETTVSAGFLLETDSFPNSLEKGENLDIALSWTPKSVEQSSGKLIISTNDQSNPEQIVTLTGKGSDNSILPKVVLFSPRGGDVIEPGSIFEIKWSVLENRSAVKQNIFLSDDGGLNYKTALATGLKEGLVVFEWKVPPDMIISKGKIKVEAIDEAQNIGEDHSLGVFTIPDRQPPTIELQSILPDSLEIGSLVQLAWQFRDNGRIASQNLFLVRGDSVTPISAIKANTNSFDWNTNELVAGKDLKILLSVRDQIGNETKITSNQFTAQPQIINISRQEKSVLITGLGFQDKNIDIAVNGIRLPKNIINVDSQNKITLRGKPKKLKISPTARIIVIVNDVVSKDFEVK